jgi:hypothetical protein
MSTDIKLNALLSLPKSFNEELIVGKTYTILKSGYRILPLLNPMEISTHDHKYLGKVTVTELRITPQETYITFVVNKLFNPQESEIFTRNFIKKI